MSSAIHRKGTERQIPFIIVVMILLLLTFLIVLILLGKINLNILNSLNFLKGFL